MSANLGLRTARAACDLAAGMLPRKAGRRYAAEWRADLAVDPSHALGYATSVVIHLPVLWLTLFGMGSSPIPLRCRLRLHEMVTVHDNPDNRRFTSHICTRCGHVKDDWRGPNKVNDGLAWGASTGQLH